MSDAVLVTWHGTRQRGRHRPGLQVQARAFAAFGALAIALLLLALAVFGMARLLEASAAPSAAPPSPPEWVDVARPVRIFDLETPLLRGLPLVYSARRRTAGDGREDMLAYGAPGSGAPALLLRLDRGAAAVAATSLSAAIARQTAEAGLSVERSGLADRLRTRFGRFEVAAFTLSDASAADVPCDGFRLALDTPAFTISGLACGTPGKPVTRDALGCLLDRLDLASGGDDRAMIEFFAASERQRNAGCAGARLTPEGLHAAWLDDKPVTHGRTSRRH